MAKKTNEVIADLVKSAKSGTLKNQAILDAFKLPRLTTKERDLLVCLYEQVALGSKDYNLEYSPDFGSAGSRS